MKTKSYIALSGSVCIILIIIAIVIGLNNLHNLYMDVFHIDYLWDNGFCDVLDEEGNTLVDKDTGSLFGKDGVYSIEYCAFHPLMISDPMFKEQALTLYGGPGKLIQSFWKFLNGTWKLPDQNMLKIDPPLSSMIINPWYTSDDAYFTPVTVDFSTDLSTFKIGPNKFIGMNPDGLYLSWSEEEMNYNNTKLQKCKGIDLTNCEKSPATCDCKFQKVIQYYLYTNNRIIIELPMQLYLGNQDEKVAKDISIKVNGVVKTRRIEPLKIETLAKLKQVIEAKFYAFKDEMKVAKITCDKISEKDQKKYDSACKFFTSDSLSGLVTVFRRILVIHLPNSVIDAYIEEVQTLINKNKKLSYLQFFIYLSCTSYRDKIKYIFVPFKNKK